MPVSREFCGHWVPDCLLEASVRRPPTADQRCAPATRTILNVPHGNAFKLLVGKGQVHEVTCAIDSLLQCVFRISRTRHPTPQASGTACMAYRISAPCDVGRILATIAVPSECRNIPGANCPVSVHRLVRPQIPSTANRELRYKIYQSRQVLERWI